MWQIVVSDADTDIASLGANHVLPEDRQRTWAPRPQTDRLSGPSSSGRQTSRRSNYKKRLERSLQPIRGRDRIGRLMSGLITKRHEALTVKEMTVNGAAGLWLEHPDGRPYAVFG